jgi:hypothetical protein
MSTQRTYQMLPKEHIDYLEHRRDPQAFIFKLYMEIKAIWASMYSDSMEDATVALARLQQALIDGETYTTLIQKITIMRSMNVEARFRTSCARVVRDFYWKKKFQTETTLRTPELSKPYQGPTPVRFAPRPHGSDTRET